MIFACMRVLVSIVHIVLITACHYEYLKPVVKKCLKAPFSSWFHQVLIVSRSL